MPKYDKVTRFQLKRNPSVCELVVKLNGQAEDTQSDVGDGEACDKTISCTSQSPMSGHGIDNDYVSANSENDYSDV
jgi:hypothetical protein